MSTDFQLLRCFDSNCRQRLELEHPDMTCPQCGGVLEIELSAMDCSASELKNRFRERKVSNNALDVSGVWRFREFLPLSSTQLGQVVTMGEGNTPLLSAPQSAAYAGLDELQIKHLGWNPTGSFKDYGMTVAVSRARILGARSVACASTGNTSASMAAYAAQAGMSAVVFIPQGQIAYGKLAQSLEFGAHTLQVDGNFDVALNLLRELSAEAGLYLVNSLNPFRIEGQKTALFELLEQLEWNPPDRIVLPGGNLGNVSAFGKALREARENGLIERVPSLLLIQAAGAAPFANMLSEGQEVLQAWPDPSTLATAIKIGNPVSWQKALDALRMSNGHSIAVTEQEIADGKAILGRDGIGCEPASATTLAGVRKLCRQGIIAATEKVVLILTGHQSKDAEYTVAYHQGELESKVPGDEGLIEPRFGNRPIRVAACKTDILASLAKLLDDRGGKRE